jgi:hypothetical protein
MDNLQERFDACEHQLRTLAVHIHAVERRLRWWRGLACGLFVLSLLTWALPWSTAQEAPPGGERGLAPRVAALEKLLKHFTQVGNEVIITGANLRIVNGLGQTDCGEADTLIPNCPNGLGNLIVGYNESRRVSSLEDIRTGSHNVVVGSFHNFSRFGGVVVGLWNEISGEFAAVSGGQFSTASGRAASVSGGAINTASGEAAAVSGGLDNTASGEFAAVSGGFGNTASGFAASVSGGGRNPFSEEEEGNTAAGDIAAVSGGSGNMANGFLSAVSGGRNRTAAEAFEWVAGSLIEAD